MKKSCPPINEETRLLLDEKKRDSFSFQDSLKQPHFTTAESYKREVQYDDSDNIGVLLQLYGSVWPRVFPWCLATCIFTYIAISCRNHGIIDLSINNNHAHQFMGILVSFLVVTRATLTYNRFMEARQHLQDSFRAAREIVQYSCLLTCLNTSPKAREWRRTVAYRTIVTLRMATAAVQYRSHGVNAWEMLAADEHDQTELLLHQTNNAPAAAAAAAGRNAEADPLDDSKNYRPTSILTDLAHGPRTQTDENFRAPLVWAYNLRDTLLQTRKDASILPTHALHVNESLKFLALTSEFVSAYHGLQKLITTPFPFPLVQMTRTFLFTWVFSLPLVLMQDNDTTWEVLILVFLLTFGFLGVEYVSIELDDPYGDDPSTFALLFC